MSYSRTSAAGLLQSNAGQRFALPIGNGKPVFTPNMQNSMIPIGPRGSGPTQNQQAAAAEPPAGGVAPYTPGEITREELPPIGDVFSQGANGSVFGGDAVSAAMGGEGMGAEDQMKREQMERMIEMWARFG